MFFDLFFLILSSFCHCHVWNFVGWIGVTLKAKGVNIWAMTVQNEPLNNASWEACFLVTVQIRGFGRVSATLILVESMNLCCACVKMQFVSSNIHMFGMQNCTHSMLQRLVFLTCWTFICSGEMDIARECKGSFDVTVPADLCAKNEVFRSSL